MTCDFYGHEVVIESKSVKDGTDTQLPELWQILDPIELRELKKHKLIDALVGRGWQAMEV
ncbi:MAG: hypothetical protein Fur0025_01390 [Oscillatoriaceae cyanobacterium]